MHKSVALIVAATPRSGSFLLSEILESTRLCGHPTEYIMAIYPEIWNGTLGFNSHRDYAADFLARGWTDNGVFSAKLMWPQFESFVNDLASTNVGDDLERHRWLSYAFDSVYYISLKRKDIERQAISYYLATRTNIWQDRGTEPQRDSNVAFDFDQIFDLHSALLNERQRWLEYFTANRSARVMELWFEDVVQAPAVCAMEVLRLLGISFLEPVSVATTLRRQSGQADEELLAEYRGRLALEFAKGKR